MCQIKNEKLRKFVEKVAKFAENEEIENFLWLLKTPHPMKLENKTSKIQPRSHHPPSATWRHRTKNEWFSRTIRQTTRELFAKFTKQTKATFKNEIKIWINRVTFFRISTTLTIAKLYACFYSLYLWRISYSDSNISM